MQVVKRLGLVETDGDDKPTEAIKIKKAFVKNS